MQIVHFISKQNSETVDVLHAFLSLVFVKLSDLKNSPVFWPILYIAVRSLHPSPVRASIVLIKFR